MCLIYSTINLYAKLFLPNLQKDKSLFFNIKTIRHENKDSSHRQFKTLLIFLVCFFGMNTSIYSQYDIEGAFEIAASYEVGKPGTVTFNLTSPIDSITSMAEITWSYRLNYDRNCEQVYGYIGENDCFSYYSVPSPSISNSYTLNLQPTDRAPEEITLELLFRYDAINGSTYIVRKEARLKINTIKTEEGSYVKKIISLK